MAAQLFQTTGVEEQWCAVVEPWLRRQSEIAWQDPRPTVILTPSRAESFYLRSRLVAEGVSFLALRFWTPSDARTHLLSEVSTGLHPATQPELRLLARACAEELARPPDAPEPSLASAAREPGPFLRAYDLLLGAGWSPAREGATYSRPLAREIEEVLVERKIATQAGLHRALWQQCSSDGKSLLAHLLVAGFNAAHWPLWDLLRAVVASAESSTMALLPPRGFGEQVDQLWISSWEEELGTSVSIPGGSTEVGEGAFPICVGSYERGETGNAASEDITFLASGSLTDQIEAIILQALAYLADASCHRLGIVFPEANALALGVAERLRELGIPLDDGTGCYQSGLFERRPWRSWLALQSEPSVQRLIEWLRACEAEGIACGMEGHSLSARAVAAALDDALGETLVDNLDFLTLHLEENSRKRAGAVDRFLRERVQLPESGTFPEFLRRAQEALQMLGWKEHLTPELTDPPRWLGQAPWMLSRRTFLEWLKESTDSRERTRGEGGNHFYGKVHLLIYAQMPGQTWSHLILTGLNEGRWPRVFETGAFGSRHELIALNRQSRALNQRGTAQGGQGLGHEVVRDQRGHCLLPLERQDLALRDLCAALDGTSKAVCLAAMTAESGRALLPSDFFNHAYQAKTGRVLDETAFRVLAKRTEEWCERHAALLRPPAPIAEEFPFDLAETYTAYAARRNPTQPFGRYEFAYAQPPPQPIQLACKTWDQAWNHPPSVWLEKIVGVAAWPEGQLAWPRAVGTWVHRWLAASLSEGGGDKGELDFLPRLRRVAEAERVRVRAGAEQAGIELYPWWNHVWGKARAITLGLGDALAPQLRDRYFLSEYSLPDSLQIALPGTDGADFTLRGKIDLLLIDPGSDAFDRNGGNFANCACWVIDFKTGSAKNLTDKQLEKGIGLQTLLYALAVRAAGAEAVAVSLQTFDAALKPQVQMEQILAATTLFRSLSRLHREGIFGMRPAAESDYGFAPQYPMATRPIPSGVLESKWALTHGGQIPEEES